mgnify:CR=1 FL=1
MRPHVDDHGFSFSLNACRHEYAWDDVNECDRPQQGQATVVSCLSSIRFDSLTVRSLINIKGQTPKIYAFSYRKLWEAIVIANSAAPHRPIRRERERQRRSPTIYLELE